MKDRTGTVLIFGGTTEGRLLAEKLTAYGISHTVSVATKYGEKIELENGESDVLVGRKDGTQIAALLQEGSYCAVVDATHPFATAVSKEIRAACEGTGTPYLRLLRDTNGKSCDSDGVIFTDSPKEAAAVLSKIKGNLLLLCGSRDLDLISKNIPDPGRLYVRVLPNTESIKKCEAAGFEGRHIIAMQGPFSPDMNVALIREVGARAILTKESGREGGYDEKIRAAALCGIPAVVIKNPEGASVREETDRPSAMKNASGMDMNEVINELLTITGVQLNNEARTVILAGVGPGDRRYYTLELSEELQDAEVLFGAPSVVSRIAFANGPVQQDYDGEKIAAFLHAHPAYTRALVAFSGDISLSSGAAKAADILSREGYTIRKISGISSVTVFAQKLGLRLEECTIVSAHGRTCDVGAFVRKNRQLIVLVSGAEDALEICRKLPAHVTVTAGCELGTDEEEIVTVVREQGDAGLHGRILLHILNPHTEDA